jgi:predicted nuclease of predicted toxin-antitoxin system
MPGIDVERVQDVGLLGIDDREILAWAAEQNRVLVTRDRGTIPGFLNERLRRGERVAGVIMVRERLPLGQLIEELLIVAYCSFDGELENRIEYLPIHKPTRPRS